MSGKTIDWDELCAELSKEFIEGKGRANASIVDNQEDDVQAVLARMYAIHSGRITPKRKSVAKHIRDKRIEAQLRTHEGARECARGLVLTRQANRRRSERRHAGADGGEPDLAAKPHAADIATLIDSFSELDEKRFIISALIAEHANNKEALTYIHGILSGDLEGASDREIAVALNLGSAAEFRKLHRSVCNVAHRVLDGLRKRGIGAKE